MNKKTIERDLGRLFESWAGEAPTAITPMLAHGSDRRYFRINGKKKTAVGVHNRDRRENEAFLHFSRVFRTEGLPVPEIYHEQLEKGLYLEEDLGEHNLFDVLSRVRPQAGFSDEIIAIYSKVVELLPQFQIRAGKNIDYKRCYPRSRFDKQSMLWDLNYFKYYFLKLAKISFDEQYLEDDFETFTNFLLQADSDFFLYRDFQSRNIMIRDGEPYFIDYQGGRKGPLQYDIASLLFDAKADIPQDVHDALLERYIAAAGELIPIDRSTFMQYYHGYVFIRIMQALGAYGFRGFYERKKHFLKSVPYAIRNLEWLLRTAELPVSLPALTAAWEQLVRSSSLRQLGNADLRLTVRIQSFSYKRGIPVDEKGHGGGFVFDCRVLPNPGRQPEFAELTGNDDEVIRFLAKEKAAEQYFAYVSRLADMAVANYQSRNFTDLMIAFGCTGGQHRSVYFANRLAAHLREKHDISVDVRHRELEFMRK